MLGDQEGFHAMSGMPHGSHPGRQYSQACVRTLDRGWLRARPTRSLLACRRAGALGSVGGRVQPQTACARSENCAGINACGGSRTDSAEDAPNVTFEARENGYGCVRNETHEFAPGDQYRASQVCFAEPRHSTCLSSKGVSPCETC